MSYSKPSKDTILEYVRRIMFLKGIIETRKLVSQICHIYTSRVCENGAEEIDIYYQG